jgi:hypothetical protein
VYGLEGSPLYSWRVVLLQYIEQQDLFDEFHKDEPWDNPHNIRLLERMPPQYAPPRYNTRNIPTHHTLYHVFVGKGTAFEKGGVSLSNFPDGTSNTLLIVEAGDPVPWSKPEDIAFEPGWPLPPLRGPFREMFRALFADGSVRSIRNDADENRLRAAVARNGGEKIDLE